MLEISPAILTADFTDFKRQIEAYSQLPIEQIDIDINRDGDHFPGQETVSLVEVLPLLSSLELTYGLHLMVDEPMVDILEVLPLWGIGLRINFYVHQETKIDGILDLKLPDNYQLCLAVKAESELKGVDFYQQFPEIQLMTIITGVQGNPFKSEILERVTTLRELGYKGKISLDGGINVDTAKEIVKYEVDRISVGSYFSRAANIVSAFGLLHEIVSS